MKLPHWAQLLLGLVVVLITWVMQHVASGDLVLPAVAITILTVVKTAVGILSDSPSTMAKLKMASAVTRVLGLWCMLLLTVAAFALLAACSSGCHSTDPPLQIVAECGVADIQQVMTILDAHKAAEMRERVQASGFAFDGGRL